MPRKKSHDPNFRVDDTVGKAAEGEDSLLSLNEAIQAATSTAQIFIPMKRICAAISVSRKITAPGFSKIRQGGTPDDFLNFATLSYVIRWQKQFDPPHGRKPVSHILNWIPYISNTIRYCLINYNKEVQDFDFLPLPNHFTDSSIGQTEEDDIPDNSQNLNCILIKGSMSVEVIHSIIMSLPEELEKYYAEILYYIRNGRDRMLDEKNKNFIIIGTNIFNKEFREWVM